MEVGRPTSHWRRRVKRLQRAELRKTHNPAAIRAALRRLEGLS